MANLKSGQPAIDSTLSSPNVVVERKNLSRAFKVSPESYTTIDDLVKATKEDVMPDLVKTYGDQGITGFLKLTGAINSGGSSRPDRLVGRRSSSQIIHCLRQPYTVRHTDDFDVTDATFQDNVQVNDVVMEAKTGVRFIVQAGGVDTAGTSKRHIGQARRNSHRRG